MDPCDSYAILSINGEKVLQTNVTQNQAFPQYNQEYITPTAIPKTSNITIEIRDSDVQTGDKLSADTTDELVDKWTIKPEDINGKQTTYNGTKNKFTNLQNDITFEAVWIEPKPSKSFKIRPFLDFVH